MKTLIICNNVQGNNDGIGKHARIVAEEIKKRGHHVEILSGETWNMNKYKKIISMEMSKVFIKAIKIIKDKDFDNIIIEYPFSEYNPLIILFYILLFQNCRKRKIKLAFSMHEYDRVHPLRKKIIDIFLKYCDVIFVSEKKYFTSLSMYKNKMVLRTISNNIIRPNTEKIIHKNVYCYIGLVNSSKAFSEMIDAWIQFNKENKYILNIISASDLSTMNLDKINGVKYFHNISNEETASIIFNSSFSIIPILPEIGYNNSSFITSVQCGCIPIGKFNKDLINEPFIIHTESYNLQDFTKVLNQSQTLTTNEINDLSALCTQFGHKFSISHTVNQMLEGLISNA